MKNMLTLEDVAALTGLCKSYLYRFDDSAVSVPSVAV